MPTADTSGSSLGQLFVERGLISASDLERALAEQSATKQRLADILVRRGLVTGSDITSALMEQLNRFNARTSPAQGDTFESVDTAEVPPSEPESGLVLLESEGPGDETAGQSPDDDVAPPLPDDEAGAAHVGVEPEASEPVGDGEAPDDHESTPIAVPLGTDPRIEALRGDSLQPQALIREADSRRRAAEAELEALGHVWEGLQKVQAELEDHSLSTPALMLELDATQARLRTRENELSAEITLWEGARQEAERASARLDELRRELAEKVHELSETQAVAATWTARVAELEAEIEEITRQATAAAHVLEVLVTTHFAAPTTETFSPGDAAAQVPPPDDEPAGSEAGFLYFVPNAESYDLVEREGAPPEVDEVVKIGELLYVVTKIGRSPLPSDSRSCVFLAGL